MIALAAAPASADAVLASLKWKARPVVIVSDAPSDPRALRQMQLFAAVRAALADRQIKILRRTRPGGALRAQLGIPRLGFAIVLVGKDGDVKQVWHDVVAPRRILDVVDQMPMRQDELRRHPE